MATVIHTADTHLGYKQYHRSERVADFADAFTQVIDTAINENIDAVIHAGDLFHDSRPNTSTILTAFQQLRRLNNHDIPFLMVVGNHEDTHESQWADIFEEMNLGTRLGKDPITVDDTAFYGIDYVPTTRRAQLDYQFTDHNADYAALIAHGGFQPLSMHDDWNAEHVLGKSNISFDAFLLGDDHTPKTETINGTLTTYPGSTERTAHDQRTDRVYNHVEFGGFTDGVQLDQRPLDTRDFVYIDELELDETDTSRTIRTQIENTDVTDAVVIITIDGDGEPFTTAEFEEQALEEGALVARARDGRSLDGQDVDFEVSFADPDDAVERRIRELELSVIGHDLDHVVRDLDGIPDSNLADEIKDDMDDRVDANPDDFETEPDLDPLPEPDDTDETAESDTNDGEPADNEPVEATDGGGSDTSPDDRPTKREQAQQVASQLDNQESTQETDPTTTTTTPPDEPEDNADDTDDTDNASEKADETDSKITDF